MDYWFRMEMSGWEKIPDAPALLIGIHAGCAASVGRVDRRNPVVAAVRTRAGRCTAPPTTR